MTDLVLADGTRIPAGALEVRTSRSSGPGGQNVNKLETRVEVVVPIRDAPWWTEDQRELVARKLRTRLDRRGRLRVTSQRHRSQWANRLEAMERIVKLLDAALQPATLRHPTRATVGARERRLRTKRIAGEHKKLRQRPSPDRGDD